MIDPLDAVALTYIYIYILEHQHALLERRVSAIVLRVHMYPLSRHVWNASLGSC